MKSAIRVPNKPVNKMVLWRKGDDCRYFRENRCGFDHPHEDIVSPSIDQLFRRLHQVEKRNARTFLGLRSLRLNFSGPLKSFGPAPPPPNSSSSSSPLSSFTILSPPLLSSASPVLQSVSSPPLIDISSSLSLPPSTSVTVSSIVIPSTPSLPSSSTSLPSSSLSSAVPLVPPVFLPSSLSSPLPASSLSSSAPPEPPQPELQMSLADLFSTPAPSSPSTPKASSSSTVNTPKRKSVSSPADSVELSPAVAPPSKARKVAVISPSPDSEPVTAKPTSSLVPKPPSSAQPARKNRSRPKAAITKKLKREVAERAAYHASPEWEEANERELEKQRAEARANLDTGGLEYLKTISCFERELMFPGMIMDPASDCDDNDDLVTATGATDQHDEGGAYNRQAIKQAYVRCALNSAHLVPASSTLAFQNCISKFHNKFVAPKLLPQNRK